MIDSHAMQQERDRLHKELGACKVELERARAHAQTQARACSALEHQIYLWDQLIDWANDIDPRPED